MNGFGLTNCYEPTMSVTINRKVSRSDLAFQKLKKYEERYKTLRSFTSVLLSSGSDITDSESDIGQYRSLKYPSQRSSERDSPINLDTSKHRLREVVESSESFNTTSTGNVNSDFATDILNKSLMEQVNITQYVINNQQDMYSAYYAAARNLSKNYQPVTLENTMKFIKQSKKKRRNGTVSP